MNTTPMSDKGWQTFLDGLGANDAEKIEEGLNLMSQETIRLEQERSMRRGGRR